MVRVLFGGRVLGYRQDCAAGFARFRESVGCKHQCKISIATSYTSEKRRKRASSWVTVRALCVILILGL
jgi:hypothetical protein